MAPGSTTHLQRILLAWSAAATVAWLSPLCAQSTWLHPRVALSARLSTYAGNFDVAGVGALARVALRFESTRKPLSAQFEGAYHHFTVFTQACPACPGCGCSPEAPPSHVWTVRASCQWHLRGVPGGLYATGGLGAYTSVSAPGQPSGAAIGYDLGLGLRRAGRGLFVEARYVRLNNEPTTAWLLPLSLGFLF